MNKIKFFTLLIAASFTTYVSAQNEKIITESSSPAEDIYVDGLFAEEEEGDKSYTAKVLPYEAIRKADVPWEKRVWRLIDTREKMNLVWRAEEQPFFEILKELIKNGEITVFKDEKFKEPLSYAELENSLSKTDTTNAYNSETFEEEIKITKNTKDWRNVKQYRVKEIWYFDNKSSMLKQRILGISPLYEEQIEGVENALVIPMFWVYYPEARMPLAKYRILADENDQIPMSWTDLLDNRRFSSIIIKRSNTLNYRVEDFFNPDDEMFLMDQLFESEKIKAELFNFEHDLWEY
jgi:gliding motility associated protien GldN